MSTPIRDDKMYVQVLLPRKVVDLVDELAKKERVSRSWYCAMCVYSELFRRGHEELD